MGLLPHRAAYGWRDLSLARKLSHYAGDRATLRRLSRAVREARRSGREPDAALAGGFQYFGTRLAVSTATGWVDIVTGQYELPFARLEPAVATPSQPAAAAGETAEQWFAFALSLEGQPSLRAQAAEGYERCLQLDPQFTSAYINLGTIRYHLRDFAAAERCYRQALTLDSSYALAWFDLGNVLDETGRLSEAVDAYQAAIRSAPQYADAHYNLALAFQRAGLPRRAVPHWRQYLDIDRSSPWAAHARSQLKRSLADDVLQLVPRRA